MHDFCAFVSFFFAFVAAKLLTYCSINKNLRINQQTLSNVSVLNRIRSFGKEVEKLNLESKEIEMVEVDEMHSYTGSKKTSVGYGLLLIDMEKDSSTSLLATGVIQRQKPFWKR
jgi:hypothetical protein